MGEPADPFPDAPTGRALAPVFLPALLCAAWGVVGAATVSMARSWGWDESMHTALPAARVAVALGEGRLGAASDALLDCNQYPFGYPLLLALVQLATGLSEHVCRAVGRLVWAAGLLGLFVLARRAASDGARPGRATAVPWLALGVAAFSPLAVHYSGTLFLEAPFTALAAWTLVAWLRRSAGGVGRELLAGALAAACFFVKFNYGLLLWAGLGVDFLFECVGAWRDGRGRAFARRALALVAPGALALLWWFVLPLPDVANLAARASEHRAALAGFLQGNLELAPVKGSLRLLDWCTGFALSPWALAVTALGVAIALTRARHRPVRLLVLVLLAFLVPIARHPFHLDRFLLPIGLAAWPLAALGWSFLLPRKLGDQVVVAWLALGVVRVSPGFDADALVRRIGLRSDEQSAAQGAYIDQAIRERSSVVPWRTLETNGLLRAESDALLDLFAANVGKGERWGWIGGQSECAPAALHLGLLARSGDRERFLRDAGEPTWVTVAGADPQWDDARIDRFANESDVVFATDPPDLKGRGTWNFLARYVERLRARPDRVETEVGSIAVAKPLAEPLVVRLLTFRVAP